ncbi:hypothetical protein C2S51_029020 [Perilla frutescens var. frutescens]|nr:hypothetical protein C2S51_029020 [Perilla frutescens var. frutescens]
MVRAWGSGLVVKKEERRTVVSTEYGEISAVRIGDGINGSYLLHFFSLEPNSVLLPVVLNADMVFYVHAGRGQLSWTEEEELMHIDIRRGDVHRLLRGTVLYMRSDEMEQERLKIHALFANSNDDLHGPETGPYTSIQDMVLGFDTRILQATFKVSEEVIDEVLGGTKAAAITHADQFCRGIGESCKLGLSSMKNKKKKKETKEKEKEKGKDKEKRQVRLFNILEADKEIENCNGWSTTVTQKQLPALEGSNIGLYMVNLAPGSMMGPHWNEMDTEVVVILEGSGMVRVVSGSARFQVEQGDVFAVPRFHPMAQMAFNNGTFVFLGFSRITQRNRPRFIAGGSSVLQILSKQVLEIAFNVSRKTLDELLAAQDDSVVISSCTSCAEQEMQMMEEGGGGGAEEEETERQQEKERRKQGREEEEEERWEEERKEREEEAGSRHEETEEPPHEHEHEHENHHLHDGGVRRILKNKKMN